MAVQKLFEHSSRGSFYLLASGFVTTQRIERCSMMSPDVKQDCCLMTLLHYDTYLSLYLIAVASMDGFL
jgi:hypothetical protein